MDEKAWETALHSENPAAQANIVCLAAEAPSRFVYEPLPLRVTSRSLDAYERYQSSGVTPYEQ